MKGMWRYAVPKTLFGGGAAPPAPLEYIGVGGITGGTTATRTATVHASTAAGDRVFVIISTTSQTTSVSVDTDDHPTATLLGRAPNQRLHAYEVVATASTKANGIDLSNCVNNTAVTTVTYRGGSTDASALGHFGTTSGWLAVGSTITCTWPTFTPPTEGIYAFNQVADNGARTWTRATEIRHVNHGYGFGVARQATPNVDPVIMYTSVATPTAYGLYISLA